MRLCTDMISIFKDILIFQDRFQDDEVGPYLFESKNPFGMWTGPNNFGPDLKKFGPFLKNVHFFNKIFKLFSGVQVSVCEHNQCQKCCNSECTDIKSMIRTRRKFSSSKCNKCLESKCNHDQEIVAKKHFCISFESSDFT